MDILYVCLYHLVLSLNSSALTSSIFYVVQVNESAKKDLKEGMKLYNSENNIGLKNAWNIIQAEVTYFISSKKVTIWSSRLLQSVKCDIRAWSKLWLMQVLISDFALLNIQE